MKRSKLSASLGFALATLATSACGNNQVVDCQHTGTCNEEATGSTGGSNGTGGDGGAGTGGATACETPCEGATPHCDEESGACVECLESSDCTDAAAPRCDGGACVGCTEAEDCVHIAGRPLCDEESSSCVECTPATEEDDCGTKSCDPATHTCGPHDRGSRSTCRSCVSDSDCQANYRCVPMEYPLGMARDEGYCLQITPGCEEPYSVTLSGRSSLSGVSGSNYCGINEDLTTCEAVRALEGNWRCDPDTPGDGFCWPPLETVANAVEVPGALCRTVGDLAGHRCTYACAVDANCTLPGSPGQFCGDGGDSGSVNYCGGGND